MHPFSVIARSAVTIAFFAMLPGSGMAAPPVTIRLKPVVEVQNRLVQLTDLTQLADSSLHTLQHADLVQIPEGQSLAVIDRSLIDVRLRLLGLKDTDYKLLGPDQVIVLLVSSDAASPNDTRFRQISATRSLPADPVDVAGLPMSDLKVEQTIQSVLRQQFDLPEDDVKVQLLRPFVDAQLQNSREAADLRIEVTTPADFPYGRANLMVRFWDQDRLTSSRMAYVEVRRRQQLLVARRSISLGSSVTADSVAEEVRFVDNLRDQLQLSDLENLRTRRTIRPGEILGLSDFREQSVSTASGTSDQVIRAHDAVRIVGQRKGLQFVVPSAEAMQSGRTGQLIRVKNLHSGKIIVGRVVSAGEVEVLLE